MRLIEIRLLEGPNLYRLEPTVKIEVAVGRRRTWYGRRDPAAHAVVRLGAPVRPADAPPPVRGLAAWSRRLLRLTGTRAGRGPGERLPVTIHRTSEPGGWVVALPWREHERAAALAETAWRLAEADRDPSIPLRSSPALRRTVRRLRGLHGAGPSWLTDAQRRIPIASITGTNGKTTTTRMLSHILRGAGRRVGTTTSDGVLLDERLVEPGDWTGPGGARQVLERGEIEVAVLETARGGILLRGLGYESNDVAIVTNISSDHLDLQGIHTLPELAEVKAVVARVTRPQGTVVLAADDPLVLAVAGQVRARVALWTVAGRPPAAVRRHLAGGGRGRAYLVEAGWLVEAEGSARRPIVAVAEVPATLLGLARHNVANALAAAAGARALGCSVEEVAAGLRDFRAVTEQAPGRLNLYRLGERIVIVDFAHNEAGLEALLEVAAGIAGGAAGRARPVTAIVGTAGDRPDDTLRGIGRIAAQLADRVVIKETLHYLRGRTRASYIGELQAGLREGGATADAPVFESEPAALRAALAGGPGPAVIALMCHEDREAVEAALAEAGARPIADEQDLLDLLPRLQPRPLRLRG
ncbi:MAG TPA: Mur ligase family protein [Candidatus Limnocylindrales bacterium]|nr:Mur ligase family protein [Candidatus Limnocylindrales bacterium]